MCVFTRELFHFCGDLQTHPSHYNFRIIAGFIIELDQSQSVNLQMTIVYLITMETVISKGGNLRTVKTTTQR